MPSRRKLSARPKPEPKPIHQDGAPVEEVKQYRPLVAQFSIEISPEIFIDSFVKAAEEIWKKNQGQPHQNQVEDDHESER